MRRLDDDEKGRDSIPTPGGTQETNTVNESGLYSLTLGSRKLALIFQGVTRYGARPHLHPQSTRHFWTVLHGRR